MLGDICKRGHNRQEHANKFGQCRACRRFRSSGKPESSFFCRRGHLRTPENVTPGRTCKECMAERAKTASQKEQQYLNSLKYKLKISTDDYNKLFTKQNGKCSICKTHQSLLKRRLSVDHNHQTGQVRGLLCSYCNTGLGMFKENIDALNRSILYLQEKIYD